jgi:hypothetical protein
MAKPSRVAHTLIGASVGCGALLTRIPTIDDVLNDHATALRDDFLAYRNHVYRIVNLCVAIARRSELEKIAVAAVFHDLGIWTNGTFDYIAPSIALAHDYLVARAREGWTAEIEGMIATTTRSRGRRPIQLRSSRHSGEPTGST